MPIQKFVTSEKNNITINDFIGEKDRVFFDVTTRTFRLSDGVTPGGIVLNTGGGGGGGYNDFSVDLHLNRATANSGEVLSWSGTDYEWVAQPDISAKIELTDLSIGAEGTASGDGAIAYNNATGVFTYTPPDFSDKITLTDLSIGVGAPPTGNGAIAYDNTTGVFSYTPPFIPDVTDKITLTDLSIGAEQPAQGDGAINYDNTEGVFRYTPPFIPSVITDLGISDGSAGQVLTTDGSGNFSFTTVSSGGGSAITIQDEGSALATAATTINFVGAGVTASGTGATKTITIAGGGGGGTTVNPEFTESITLDSDESTDPVSTQFFVFYGNTTDATTTRLYKDSSNTSIAVPQQTTMFFEADIVGRNNTTPDYGAFKVKGVIDNNSSGTTSLIMNHKEIMHAGSNELFDANIVADNALDLLAVEVNGEAATNIRWSALVKVVSVKQT